MKTEARWHWVSGPRMRVWVKCQLHVNYGFFTMLHDPYSKILWGENFLKYLFIFIYSAVPSLSCCMWDIVSGPGIKPGPRALGAQSLSHWTIREVALWGENFVSKCRSLAEINWEGVNFICRMGQSVCLPDTPESLLKTTCFLKVCLCLVKKVGGHQEGQIHTAT